MDAKEHDHGEGYRQESQHRPAQQGGSAAIRKKRVATADGGWTIVRTLDINSPYFDEAYLHAIRCNIAKARRENRRVLGVADFVPRKR